jgi:hypothetical protein
MSGSSNKHRASHGALRHRKIRVGEQTISLNFVRSPTSPITSPAKLLPLKNTVRMHNPALVMEAVPSGSVIQRLRSKGIVTPRRPVLEEDIVLMLTPEHLPKKPSLFQPHPHAHKHVGSPERKIDSLAPPRGSTEGQDEQHSSRDREQRYVHGNLANHVKSTAHAQNEQTPR